MGVVRDVHKSKKSCQHHWSLKRSVLNMCSESRSEGLYYHLYWILQSSHTHRCNTMKHARFMAAFLFTAEQWRGAERGICDPVHSSTDSWLIHAAVGVHYHPSSHDPPVCVVDRNAWKCTQAWCCPWQRALGPAKTFSSQPSCSFRTEWTLRGVTAHFSLPLNAKQKCRKYKCTKKRLLSWTRWSILPCWD